MYNKANTGSNYSKPATASSSGYNKPAASSGKSTKERSTTIGASLSFGIKENDKVNFHDVAPLFTEQDKNGNDYFSITLKEELTIPAGAKLYVRPRSSK